MPVGTRPVRVYPAQLPVDSGLVEAAAQLVGIAGAVVLLLLLVAFGAFAYRSLRGEMRWPDESDDEDAVSRSEDDDDWKYS